MMTFYFFYNLTNNLNFSKTIGQKTSNYSKGNILPNVTEKIKQNPRQQSAQKITLKRSFWKRKASLSNKVGVLKNLQVYWISLYPFVEPEKNISSFKVTSPPHHSFSETLWRNLNMEHWTCGSMNSSPKYKNYYTHKSHQALAETCLNFDVNGKIKMTPLPWQSPSNGMSMNICIF